MIGSLFSISSVILMNILRVSFKVSSFAGFEITGNKYASPHTSKTKKLWRAMD